MGQRYLCATFAFVLASAFQHSECNEAKSNFARYVCPLILLMMAIPGDQDWQSTKNTVLERNCHMFNNPSMSDIAFTCGESKRKSFYAHKYVLATSSVVLYAMFYGDLAEKNSVVHLPDTDEESLEEFLRFLYTDECTLTPELSLKVMYLAKKYIVPSLTARCAKVIQDSVEPENAVTILEQAIQFVEKEVEKKCWQIIDSNTTKAVTSDGFNNISQETLIELLKRDTLNIKEIDLFRSVLKWSEAECSRNELEATGKNRRAVLGDAIYQIRFLSMSQKEFAEHVSLPRLLTTEEIVPIFHEFSGIEVAGAKWKLPPRQSQESLTFRCRRFVNGSNSFGWSYENSEPDILCFRVNKHVNFHGARLFGDAKGSKYEVSLDVNGTKVSGTYTAKCEDKDNYGFDVMLPIPVAVDHRKIVTMVATIKGPLSYHGCQGQKSVVVSGVTVTFSNAMSSSSNGTTTTGGQFDQIILSI